MSGNKKKVILRSIFPEDLDWMTKLIIDSWASTKIVTRGVVHDATNLPGVVAIQGDERVGLLLYQIESNMCEIVSLNSLREGIGIGTALLEYLEEIAKERGCQKVWLITTNDNTPAIKFYEARGFHVSSIHQGAITESRKLKPEIPIHGLGEVLIEDEVEMEKAI
ncbi:MAG: GNAT family N-acetyltransferase [Candidatus Thorarchaeota archaeon]